MGAARRKDFQGAAKNRRPHEKARSGKLPKRAFHGCMEEIGIERTGEGRPAGITRRLPSEDRGLWRGILNGFPEYAAGGAANGPERI